MKTRPAAGTANHLSDSHRGGDDSGGENVLAKRLAEPAPGRIQLLAGPRQVDKTTLLLEIAEQAGKQAVYAAADAPEAALPGFWERLLGRAEDTAVALGPGSTLVSKLT